jgi:ABC-type sulfate transport system permease component
MDYAGANHMALVLLIISFVVLSVVYGVNRKIGRHMWALWAAR